MNEGKRKISGQIVTARPVSIALDRSVMLGKARYDVRIEDQRRQSARDSDYRKQNAALLKPIGRVTK
jgi:hypothetical protein